ncbi:MAG: DnaA/Hda family protein, partial [Pseudomonadota bacterium]|nr:DnaA/Hda family protein [Pseudomonadota bacterium]
MTDKLSAQWARIRGRLRAEYGEAAYRSWLKPMTFVGVEGRRVRISVPTRFMRDWIESQYAERLVSLWTLEASSVEGVDVFVTGDEAEDNDALPAASPAALRETEAQNNISAPLDPRFTFENFIVGKPNELAFAAARRVAEAETAPYNPLFLYSGVGLGKTHLMHAIAWHIRQTRPEKRAVYLSAEKFMYQFIRALRFRDTVAFKEQFRSVDVLMIDDVQFIARKDSTQEEFFHTFNALVDQNRQIVISADK